MQKRTRCNVRTLNGVRRQRPGLQDTRERVHLRRGGGVPEGDGLVWQRQDAAFGLHVDRVEGIARAVAVAQLPDPACNCRVACAGAAGLAEKDAMAAFCGRLHCAAEHGVASCGSSELEDCCKFSCKCWMREAASGRKRNAAAAAVPAGKPQCVTCLALPCVCSVNAFTSQSGGLTHVPVIVIHAMCQVGCWFVTTCLILLMTMFCSTEGIQLGSLAGLGAQDEHTQCCTRTACMASKCRCNEHDPVLQSLAPAPQLLPCFMQLRPLPSLHFTSPVARMVPDIGVHSVPPGLAMSRCIPSLQGRHQQPPVCRGPQPGRIRTHGLHWTVTRR